METNKWKRDLQFNQIQKQDGSTVVMSFGKSATEEDKNLIAAAPELLEALEYVNHLLANQEEAECKFDVTPEQIKNDVLNKIKSAISKATKPC